MQNITFECSYCHNKRTFTIPLDESIPADVHLFTDKDGYQHAFCSYECYALHQGIKTPRPERYDVTTTEDRFIRRVSS